MSHGRRRRPSFNNLKTGRRIHDPSAVRQFRHGFRTSDPADEGGEAAMKEITLRKTHRNLGLTLAFFLLLQGGSGLLLTVGEMFATETGTITGESHGHTEEVGEGLPAPETSGQPDPDRPAERHGLVGRLHHGKGVIWNLYRLVVGGGLLALLASGVAIFLKGRARTANKPSF
jgi:hypothetical protein